LDSSLLQRKQLTRIGNSIVILVNPHHQLRINRVASVDDTIAIPAVRGLIEHREREKPIAPSFGWLWLGSNIAEKLRAVVDLPIPIPVKRQKPAVPSASRPRHLHRLTISEEVEFDAILGARQLVALSGQIDDDWVQILTGAIITKVTVASAIVGATAPFLIAASAAFAVAVVTLTGAIEVARI
jgi:hypothetical protein